MTPAEFAARLLAEPARAGLYRAAPGWAQDTPEILWKPLATAAIDRERLLAALGRALEFPAYYGQNWDAAWDCLTELDWPADRLLAVRLPIAADCAVDAAALEIFLELLADACRHWAEQGRALCLLVETAREDIGGLDALPVPG
ncbi:barstar family protein [Pseudomonas stutzeri]|nr:barstar family protein [Stutzerimonas stutzeri]